MNIIRTCHKLKLKRLLNIYLCQNYCSKNSDQDISGNNINRVQKYKEFRDEDSLAILDVEEEKWKIEDNEEIKETQIYTRGVTGVYDIHELIEYLKEHKASNIFVTQLPKNLNYVDYIVIVTGKSRRHIIALGEIIRRMYKNKRNSDDIIPKIEGETSDWVALDLGNIVLHVMSSDKRELYDLESLWGIGPKYDEKSNKTDDKINELLKLHSISLDDLEPKN